MESLAFKLTIANRRFWIALPLTILILLPLAAAYFAGKYLIIAPAEWLHDRLWTPVNNWIAKGTAP